MKIITHRGLDAEHHHAYTESSREAFSFFLDAGFGLEFDVQITKDLVPVISHDSSLERLTGTAQPLITEMAAEEFLNTPLPHGRTLTLTEIITLMKEAAPHTTGVHALHLKHSNQSPESISVLLPFFKEILELPIMVFDVKPDVARALKTELPELCLAASVAHPYDVARYNQAVDGTLITVEAMEEHRALYDWAWLDEWDRAAANSQRKDFYTEETFANLRALGMKLAIVSPELHATSPKLLGGESHEDAKDIKLLETRWSEIAALKPDAVCTDYPFKISHLLSQ